MVIRIVPPREPPHVELPRLGLPGLAEIKRAAADAGALGCSLSGSGPSLFALCQSRPIADRVAAAMTAAVRAHIGGEPQTYVSQVAPQGARVI